MKILEAAHQEQYLWEGHRHWQGHLELDLIFPHHKTHLQNPRQVLLLVI
jgi:hypothetical protein